ncbi:MAG: response regulator transcription factor [bacterium]
MHVMVVEDDDMMAATLAKGITEDGYRVTPCGTAADALRITAADPPDLIVLDIGLPDRSGLDVLQTLRSRKCLMPVIILTARDAVRDRVKGLDAGADDYLIKPFAFAELLARIRARLRHSEVPEPTMLRVDELTIDVLNRKVMRGAREIILTGQEFALLRYLVDNVGKTVSREMIARDVWHIESRATPLDNVIDVHISHLRAKVDRGFATELIQTVWGVGFALKADK